MAEKTMQLDIVSAEKALFHGTVKFLSVTGSVGNWVFIQAIPLC